MPGKRGPKIVQYQNCLLLRDHELIRDDLWVQDGKIIDPEKLFFDTKVAADEKVDCENSIIAPGYIELQLNGAFGVDFSCGTENIEEGVQKVAQGLLSQGVTSFCPTLITGSAEDYHKLLPHFSKTRGGKDGAGVLGVHLEGPFISREKKGAHPEHCIRTFDHGISDVLSMYGSLDNIAIVTLAPEIPCSDQVIKELTSRGITVSLGHSMANLSQGEEAVRHGASFITHLFNAMLPFHHRDPHLVGLLASDEIPRPVYFGLIADGIHTHSTALRIAFRTHSKGVVLVTDAIPAMGLGVGIHHMGQQTIEIREDGHAVVAGTDTLCGSIATMEQCVKFFQHATGCSVMQALEAASLHPAEALGITGTKGTLEYGTDADFILLDHDLNVRQTHIAGECVWVRKEGSRRTSDQ